MVAQLKLNRLLKFVHLHQEFQSKYSIEPALSQALRQEALRVRHQVYCTELNWEEENQYEQEIDSYDAQSLHCLLRDQQTGDCIGCVRIIYPLSEYEGKNLPFMLACGRKLKENHPNVAIPFAEVSRLAILKEYRKSASNVRELNCPLMVTSLYLGVLHLARRSDIEHLYILAAPALILQLKLLGARVEQIGDPIDCNGLRAPYVIRVSLIIQDMHIYLRPIFQAIAEQIDQAFSQQPSAVSLH
ncbi:MAG: PEP-CTERM/exosortase system-associated acyltransferase [Motiliproteus sp.]